MVEKSTLGECVKDISFPIGGPEIVDCASGNNCPREVISQMQRMSPRTYDSEEELLCQLGNSRYCD